MLASALRLPEAKAGSGPASAGASEILLQVVEAMTSAAGVQSALDRLAELALHASGADRCAILTMDPSGRRRLLPTAGAAGGGDTRALWRRFSTMEPIDLPLRAGESSLWDADHAVLVNDAATCQILPERWRAEWGTKSFAFVVLKVGTERFGVLAVDYVDRPHEFTTSEASLLEAIAGAAGVAINTATLLDRLQRAVASERTMAETLRAQLRVVDALRELSGVVVRTSEVKSLLRALNLRVADLGFRCVRVSFSDEELAALLNAAPLEERDRIMLRQIRSSRSTEPIVSGNEMWIPVPMERRVVGVLRTQGHAPPGPSERAVGKAIAAGLGEVAFKALLKRTAERRAREVAVAEERERIARDLHDTLGQTFFGIGLKLEELLVDVNDPDVVPRLRELRGLAAQAVADVRSAVYALSFLHVRAKGFIPSLRALTRQFSRATGVFAELRLEGKGFSVSEEVQEALFRMAHEALVNVDRHARATGVIVTMTAREDGLVLAIRDDGVGLDQRQAADWRSAAHFGMRMMARAIEEVGGTFRAANLEPRGMLVEATVGSRARKPRTPRVKDTGRTGSVVVDLDSVAKSRKDSATPLSKQQMQ